MMTAAVVLIFAIDSTIFAHYRVILQRAKRGLRKIRLNTGRLLIPATAVAAKRTVV
jgi:hypothetical protein